MSDPDKPEVESPATETADAGAGDTTVQEVKWWIDTGNKQQSETDERVPKGVIERWAFDLLKDYRQERALQNIVDINGQVLRELGNNEERWVYLSLGVGEFPPKRLNYIKDSLRIPRYARALAIDAGYSIRVLITGNPPGREGAGHQLHRSSVHGLLDQPRADRGTDVPLHRGRPQAVAELDPQVPAQEYRRDVGVTSHARSGAAVPQPQTYCLLFNSPLRY